MYFVDFLFWGLVLASPVIRIPFSSARLYVDNSCSIRFLEKKTILSGVEKVAAQYGISKDNIFTTDNLPFHPEKSFSGDACRADGKMENRGLLITDFAYPQSFAPQMKLIRLPFKEIPEGIVDISHSDVCALGGSCVFTVFHRTDSIRKICLKMDGREIHCRMLEPGMGKHLFPLDTRNIRRGNHLLYFTLPEIKNELSSYTLVQSFENPYMEGIWDNQNPGAVSFKIQKELLSIPGIRMHHPGKGNTDFIFSILPPGVPPRKQADKPVFTIKEGRDSWEIHYTGSSGLSRTTGDFSGPEFQDALYGFLSAQNFKKSVFASAYPEYSGRLKIIQPEFAKKEIPASYHKFLEDDGNGFHINNASMEFFREKYSSPFLTPGMPHAERISFLNPPDRAGSSGGREADIHFREKKCYTLGVYPDADPGCNRLPVVLLGLFYIIFLFYRWYWKDIGSVQTG